MRKQTPLAGDDQDDLIVVEIDAEAAPGNLIPALASLLIDLAEKDAAHQNDAAA